MEAVIMAQGKNDPPGMEKISRPVTDLGDRSKITFCVVEGGMQSGEPSVMIISEAEPPKRGSVALQTSLDKFLMAATGMAAMAETRWGWQRPEGYASIMPPDKATRKKMLEAIKAELEGWDDAEEDAAGTNP